MALTRPLRLKSEIAKAKAEGSTSHLPIARVWVDSGVFHLDSEFDYLIPDNLSPLVAAGIRVQVPFHGREVEALVLSRQAASELSSLKAISKVISPHSVATAESLELIAAVSARWAAHPYDILRSAIPPRVASIDKESFPDSSVAFNPAKPKRSYIHIPPAVNRFQFIATTLLKERTKGSRLIIAPDTRSVQQLASFLPDAIILDSALERSSRYRNFLRARTGRNITVIGTRSAVFVPVSDLDSIIVVDESSENHYEPRSPGWNVRDVAIVRSMKSKVSLILIGYSPSAEVARLIESKWIDFDSTKSRLKIQSFAPSQGELLPSRLISEIRKAMKVGPILFISPRKGYSQALTCSKCRNIALCTCGGKLSQSSVKAPIECVICAKVHSDWKCAWCQNTTPFLMGRGSERFAYEIGAAFPGKQITQSTSDSIHDSYDDDYGFIIATPGAAPIAKNGYAMIVILEGDRFFTQTDIRANERSRELFFSVSALGAVGATIALVMANDHPIIGALASWKPSLVSQRELREREEVHLPPFSRAITMDISRVESQSLLRGLKKSQEDGRLPASTIFLGPSRLNEDNDRIVLLTPLSDGEIVVNLLHEFQRKRSSAKKTLASIRIDPYSLSR
mgnify:FL=1